MLKIYHTNFTITENDTECLIRSMDVVSTWMVGDRLGTPHAVGDPLLSGEGSTMRNFIVCTVHLI